jgi:hypothetical protein
LVLVRLHFTGLMPALSMLDGPRLDERACARSPGSPWVRFERARSAPSRRFEKPQEIVLTL